MLWIGKGKINVFISSHSQQDIFMFFPIPTELHLVSKNCAKVFLSEFRQISINFDNFWQRDRKEAKIMQGALIFHLIYFSSSHYRVKRRCSKLLGYTTLKVVICN